MSQVVDTRNDGAIRLQAKRATRFRALHEKAFIIPNPWDAGSARILAGMGFAALATTSAGTAYTLAKPDGALNREETLTLARTIVEATDLPVAADLENGFGHDPEAVARTIREAEAMGLIGGSIEDASGDPAKPIYDFNHAVERIAAAVEAAGSCPTPFVLTARAENFLHGRPDLDDTLRRLQAFEAAGAEVLYAPGLPGLEAVGLVCGAVTQPVNVLASACLSAAQIAAAGGRRISLGSALSRAALGALVSAGREILDRGTFTFATTALPYGEANRLMTTK